VQKDLDKLQGEPYLGKREKRKNTAERLAEAKELIAKGHLVSPLGKPKKRGRLLNPSMARPIKDSGNVTIPQLWAAYTDIFAKVFGLPDFLPTIFAATHENVSRFFDDMRQRFLDCTGTLPDNREIYEYLMWFHQPQRLKWLLSTNKKAGSPGYVHPNQLLGIVHIKKYHDAVDKAEERKEVISERVADQRKMTKFVMSAYDKMRNAKNEEMVYLLANYGYVIVAEFLHDYKSLDASSVKKRIIEMMVDLLKASSNKPKAVEFLRYAWKATEANEPCFQSAIWPDWREACKDMLDIAIQLSEA